MKQPPIRWVSKHVTLAIHERLLAEHGGVPGTLDEGLLDAALASPRNHFAYQNADIVSLAAAYAFAITQNHPFADGNKRVALTVAGVFMELNGYRLVASEQAAAQAMRALSAGEIREAEFANWLRTCVTKLRVARRPAKVKAATRRRTPKRK